MSRGNQSRRRRLRASALDGEYVRELLDKMRRPGERYTATKTRIAKAADISTRTLGRAIAELPVDEDTRRGLETAFNVPPGSLLKSSGRVSVICGDRPTLIEAQLRLVSEAEITLVDTTASWLEHRPYFAAIEERLVESELTYIGLLYNLPSSAALVSHLKRLLAIRREDDDADRVYLGIVHNGPDDKPAICASEQCALYRVAFEIGCYDSAVVFAHREHVTSVLRSVKTLATHAEPITEEMLN